MFTSFRFYTQYKFWSRDSAVGIATCYGLDGRESNPGEGQIFHTRLERSCGPPSLMYNVSLVSFPEQRGRSVALTTHSHPAPLLKKE
jgi:hypothetical protein